MPKKRGDRAHRTAEKRARRERCQLAREESSGKNTPDSWWSDHTNPRFTQRIGNAFSGMRWSHRNRRVVRTVSATHQ
jgi:hypothetical protein